MISQIKKFRVAVVIPEQHLSEPIPDPAGETEVIRQLIKEGFRVVDAKQVLGDLKELVTEAEEISYLESRVEMDVVTSTTSEKLAEAVFLGAKKQGLKLKVLESTNRRCVFEVPAAAAPKEETR